MELIPVKDVRFSSETVESRLQRYTDQPAQRTFKLSPLTVPCGREKRLLVCCNHQLDIQKQDTQNVLSKDMLYVEQPSIFGIMALLEGFTAIVTSKQKSQHSRWLFHV